MAIESYLYDNTEPNPVSIQGIPVQRLDSAFPLHTEYPIYIGTRGIYHEQLTKKLRRIGFQSIYPVTVELDRKLRNEYLGKYFTGIGREFQKIGQMLAKGGAGPARQSLSSAIYVVKSVFDKPLQMDYQMAPYEKEIQAGAALTRERLQEGGLTDDTGDNISERNHQFCELTALYWIWKHAQEDIVGLAHYRRHFLLPKDWLARMATNNVDVILPVPLYVVPCIEGNYKERHDSLDWDYMMHCLKEEDEKIYGKAAGFFKGNVYSPCNMFITKKEILDMLCEWLFPILFQVAANGGEKAARYQNRYPGFLSERLISFFFEKNRKRYRSVYADKNFLP